MALVTFISSRLVFVLYKTENIEKEEEKLWSLLPPYQTIQARYMIQGEDVLLSSGSSRPLSKVITQLDIKQSK